jgi:hypothetical protein
MYKWGRAVRGRPTQIDAIGRVRALPHRSDAAAAHEDVAVLDHLARGVHRNNRAFEQN